MSRDLLFECSCAKTSEYGLHPLLLILLHLLLLAVCGGGGSGSGLQSGGGDGGGGDGRVSKPCFCIDTLVALRASAQEFHAAGQHA